MKTKCYLFYSICAACLALNVVSQDFKKPRTLGEFLDFPTVRIETDLVHLLFVNTNKAFDEKVIRSLRVPKNVPVTVTYELISFVFFHPKSTNEFIPSYSEMSQIDSLLSENGIVFRKLINTNHVPLNCIRLIESRQNPSSAELDILVTMSSPDERYASKHSRLSFRFVHKGKWVDND